VWPSSAAQRRPKRAGSIKKAHGHGLRGISRGTSAAELRFCSWKSWLRSPQPEPHTMMPAPGEKSETAELLEMVQKVSLSSRSPSPRAIQSALAIAKPEKVAKSGNSHSRRVFHGRRS
jgi:hypothetical protein